MPQKQQRHERVPTALDLDWIERLDLFGGQGAVAAVLFVIVLVVVFSRIELCCSGFEHLGYDRLAFEAVGFALLFDEFRSLFELFIIGSKDRGAVLRSDIRALAVERGRVVVLKKLFKQVLVGDA